MLLRICLIVAILGGGAAVAVNFLMVKPAMEATVSQRDDQTKQKETAQSDLKKTNKQLTDTKTSLTNLNNTLTATKKELETANTRSKDLDLQLSDLNTRYTNAAARRDKDEEELARWSQLGMTPAEVIKLQDNLKTTLTNLAGVVQERDTIFRDDEEKTKELDRIRNNAPDQTVKLPEGLKGRVLAVDPKFGFVVLNIGKDKEVLQNGIMMVARDGQLIGKVQIARVDDTQSVANILPAWRHGEVMEGDGVIY